MTTSARFPSAIRCAWTPGLLVACLLAASPDVHADITLTGNTNPAPGNEGSISTTTTLTIGNTSSGTLLIDGDSDLAVNTGYIGYYGSSEGVASVTGAGSTWTNSYALHVGFYGDGTLNISNGGSVSSIFSSIANQLGSTGEVTVDGTDSIWTVNSSFAVSGQGDGILNISNGGLVTVAQQTSTGIHGQGQINFNNGTLQTAGLVARSDQLLGVGTINTSGLVSDVNLLFDQNNGLQQQLIFNSLPGQNITVNLDVDGTGTMGAGFGGTGSLAIADGVSVGSRLGYLGYAAGSTGTATVDGANSSWINTSSLFAGLNGDATLSITNGGTVQNSVARIGSGAGSTATATVDGADSNWTSTSTLDVGYAGNGTLQILNGGTVQNSGDASIARSTGSTGSVTVDGADSTWNGSFRAINVGYAGDGSLDITNGGTVTHGGSGSIGFIAGSSGAVTVNGSQSTWTSGQLRVGNSGSGTLDITNGGQLSSSSGQIGVAVGSSGVVTVDGLDSTWNNGTNLIVGSLGQGTLNITNGGDVIVGGETNIGAQGEIAFASGTLTTGGLRFAAGPQLSGVGTINASGLISDMDLVFDQSHGLQQQFTLNSEPGQNITLNLDIDGSASLGAGYQGESSLHIADGLSIASHEGYLGYEAGATGQATVGGSGSSWSTARSLYVGYYGSGSLDITNGASVASTWDTYVGYNGSGSISITGGGTLHSRYGFIGHVVGPDPSGEVTVSGPGSAWTMSNRLYVGQGGDAAVDISGGASVSNTDGYVASFTDTTAAVAVDGADSVWENRGHLYVGSRGHGELDITGGASVSNRNAYVGEFAGSAGAVTVDGEGSSWTSAGYQSGYVYIGYNGDGTLDITNGGSVSSALNMFVADQSGSTGSIVVDGADSSLNNSQYLFMGQAGDATLAITNGGQVNSGNAMIAGSSFSTSTATVQGHGSSWNSSSLNVGSTGNGILTITNGGSASSSVSYIGYNPGGVGQVTVEGAASVWEAGHLRVAERGNGTLTISAGGRVEATQLILGYHDTGVATVNLSGGTLDLSGGDLTVGAGAAAFHFTSGTLQHVNSFGASLDQQGGTIQIGNSPGTMTITGDYSLADAATLEIELFDGNGVAGTDFDQLIVDGNASLAGLLKVLIDSAYAPTVGQSWDVLTASTIITDSTFALATSAAYDLDWQLVTDGTGDTLRLTLIPEPASAAMLSLLALGLAQRRRLPRQH